jgi:hypothetical protein
LAVALAVGFAVAFAAVLAGALRAGALVAVAADRGAFFASAFGACLVSLRAPPAVAGFLVAVRFAAAPDAFVAAVDFLVGITSS